MTESKKEEIKTVEPTKKIKLKNDVDTYDSDPVLKLFALYAPECLDDSTDWYEFVGDKTMSKGHYESKGYIPVKNQSGEHVHYNGEPLYKRQIKQ